MQISDPLTSRAEAGRVVRTPFPGNRLPASRIDPISKIYLGFYPKANTTPRPNSSHDQNFIGSATTPLDNDRWTGRLDQNWSAKHNSHFTITQFSEFSAGRRWLSALQPVNTNDTRAFTMAFDHNLLLSPTTILNFKLGAVRSIGFSGGQVDGDAASWNLSPQVVNLLGGTKGRVPSLGTADTVTGIGGGSVTDNRDTIYSGMVSVQKLMGKHTLKAGFEHRRYYSNIYSGGSFNAASVSAAPPVSTSMRPTADKAPVSPVGCLAWWAVAVAPNWPGPRRCSPIMECTFRMILGSPGP